MVFLQDATLVDTNGVRDANVRIEDGTISEIGSAISPRSDEDVFDVADRFVAPGMIDAHVHIMMGGQAGSGLDDVPPNEFDLAFQAARSCEDLLKAGVTTARDLGAWGTLGIDTARAIESGLVEGPRLFPCGQNIVITGGHCHAFGYEADGPDGVRQAVREQIKRGAAVIKCMATGGVMTDGTVTAAPELTPVELEAIVEEASKRGLTVAAHADGLEGIKNAIRAGVTSIEHGSHMDREAAAMMADRGTYWIPTVKAYEAIIEHSDAPGMPREAGTKARDAAKELRETFDLVKAEGDIPVVFGSDGGTPFNDHGDVADELEYMVEYGISPETALDAATTNAAELLGLDDVGELRNGYRADLVVLEENPRQDVTAWQDVDAVFKAGERVA